MRHVLLVLVFAVCPTPFLNLSSFVHRQQSHHSPHAIWADLHDGCNTPMHEHYGEDNVTMLAAEHVVAY
jgi:hypothetical protein